MRCLSCNVILTSREATRRGVASGQFIDLCDNCFDSIRHDVQTYDNPLYAGDETQVEDLDGEDQER